MREMKMKEKRKGYEYSTGQRVLAHPEEEGKYTRLSIGLLKLQKPIQTTVSLCLAAIFQN